MTFETRQDAANVSPSRTIAIRKKEQDNEMAGFAGKLLRPVRVLIDRVQQVWRWARFAKNFHVRILDTLGLVRGKSVVYHLRSGLKLKIRPRSPDGFRVRDVFFEAPYIVPSPEELARTNRYVAFDIGASLGFYTLLLAGQDRKRVRVYSFEPCPEHFSYLKWNVETNGLDNVTISPMAVAGTNGTMKLYLHDALNRTHSLYEKSDESVEVETVTLAECFKRFNLERVDHVKIDCEGAEYDIFLNGPEDVLQRIGAISMEYHEHPEHDVSELVSHFERNGFEVERASHPLHKRILRARRLTDEGAV